MAAYRPRLSFKKNNLCQQVWLCVGPFHWRPSLRALCSLVGAVDFKLRDLWPLHIEAHGRMTKSSRADQLSLRARAASVRDEMLSHTEGGRGRWRVVLGGKTCFILIINSSLGQIRSNVNCWHTTSQRLWPFYISPLWTQLPRPKAEDDKHERALLFVRRPENSLNISISGADVIFLKVFFPLLTITDESQATAPAGWRSLRSGRQAL